jgi:glycosyltransferase involved in cell wall biosynthesis
VAIGPAEIAGTSTALQTGLRELGVDAEVAFWSPLPGPFPSTRALGRAARAAYALRAPLRRDVLHYQYGRTWLPLDVDAAWAGAWRRTRVATFHGDDCRTAEVATRLGWPMAHLKDPAADAAVLRRLGRLGRLCHGALAADLEVASYLRPHFERVYVTPVPLHTHAAPPRDEKPHGAFVVLHAPSDERVKGSAVVRQAVRSLADRTPVELLLVEGQPHAAVAAALARADVVVDQMFSVSASILALEGMRAGLPVLSHLDRRGLAPFHAELPIVAVTAETLERELEALADDEPRRRALGEAGRQYVARYHAATQAARSVLRIYDHARGAEQGLYEATPEGIRPLEAA